MQKTKSLLLPSNNASDDEDMNSKHDNNVVKSVNVGNDVVEDDNNFFRFINSNSNSNNGGLHTNNHSYNKSIEDNNKKNSIDFNSNDDNNDHGKATQMNCESEDVLTVNVYENDIYDPFVIENVYFDSTRTSQRFVNLQESLQKEYEKQEKENNEKRQSKSSDESTVSSVFEKNSVDIDFKVENVYFDSKRSSKIIVNI
jgi:hypothetical protein